MTSRCARSAPSAIWEAPSAARVSSRSSTACGLSTWGFSASFGRPGCGAGVGRGLDAFAFAGIEAPGFAFAPVADSWLRASKAPWRAARFQDDGIPWLHCRTADACFSPVARAWPRDGAPARFTAGSDFGRRPSAGLPPVSEMPVASSSQMAARSLAAPSVSPLLS